MSATRRQTFRHVLAGCAVFATALAGPVVAFSEVAQADDPALAGATPPVEAPAPAAEPAASPTDEPSPVVETVPPAEEPTVPAAEPTVPVEEPPVATEEPTDAAVEPTLPGGTDEPAAAEAPAPNEPEDGPAEPSAAPTAEPRPEEPAAASVEEPVTPQVLEEGATCPTTGGTGDGLAGGFEIDGNCGDDGSLDWASSAVSPQPSAVDGIDDDTQYTTGSSETNWPAWDGSGVAVASGQADVDELYVWSHLDGDDHIWAYLGFTRGTVTGTIGYAFELNQQPNMAPGVPDRTPGDVRFDFEQDGNGALSLRAAQTWTGTEWGPSAPTGFFFSGVSDDKQFVEVALDLTAMGILAPGCPPGLDACTLNLRSRQSASLSSALKDYASARFEAPNTCAAVQVTKDVVGIAAGMDWSFEFTIDPEPVCDTATKTASGSGEGSDVVTFDGLVPGETYTLAETTVDGYLAGGLACTGVVDLDGDPTDASVTFEAPTGLGDGPEITCAITNTAVPSEVSVTKTVTGVADGFEWWFDFRLAEEPMETPHAGEAQSATSTGAGDATVSWSGLVPGRTYTVHEYAWWPAEGGARDVAGAFETAGMSCSVEDLDGDVTDASVTFVAPLGGEGVEVECAITNAAVAGQVAVFKVVSGVAEGFEWGPFTFTLTPDDGTDPVSLVVDHETPEAAFTGLVPGVSYVLEEVEVPAGYDPGDLACSVVRADGSLSAVEIPLEIQPGDEVQCNITNLARPSQASVNKTVTGVADELAWAFDVTIDPVPAGGSSPLVVSGEGEGSDTVTFEGLVPGAVYTIAEVPVAGFTPGALACEGAVDLDGDATDASVTFQAPLDVDVEGVEVACAITNSAVASEVEVTKTVSGVSDGFEWAFDFTIDPVAEPAAVQTASSTGPGAASVGWTGLVPGATYTISETAVAGFEAAGLSCSVEDLDGDVTDASVTFVAPLGGEGVEVDCAITNELLLADVWVTKAGTATVTLPAEGGEASIDYVLEVGNDGPGIATDVVVTDVLPDEVTLATVTSSTGTCEATAGGFTCLLGTLAVGDVVTIEVATTTVADVAAGEATNVAEVTTSTPEDDLGDNADDHVTRIDRLLPRTGADLAWLALAAVALTGAGLGVREAARRGTRRG